MPLYTNGNWQVSPDVVLHWALTKQAFNPIATIIKTACLQGSMMFSWDWNIQWFTNAMTLFLFSKLEGNPQPCLRTFVVGRLRLTHHARLVLDNILLHVVLGLNFCTNYVSFLLYPCIVTTTISIFCLSFEKSNLDRIFLLHQFSLKIHSHYM